MKITIKKDENGFFIDPIDLAPFYDLDNISFYTLDEVDGGMEIQMFDKDKNLIKPKGASSEE